MGTKRDSGLGVEDGRVSVSDEVRRDHLVVRVGQVLAQFGVLARLLHHRLDLVHARRLVQSKHTQYSYCSTVPFKQRHFMAAAQQTSDASNFV